MIRKMPELFHTSHGAAALYVVRKGGKRGRSGYFLRMEVTFYSSIWVQRNWNKPWTENRKNFSGPKIYSMRMLHMDFICWVLWKVEAQPPFDKYTALLSHAFSISFAILGESVCVSDVWWVIKWANAHMSWRDIWSRSPLLSCWSAKARWIMYRV